MTSVEPGLFLAPCGAGWAWAQWVPPGFLITVEHYMSTIDRDEWDEGAPLSHNVGGASAHTKEDAAHEAFMWWAEAQGGFDES